MKYNLECNSQRMKYLKKQRRYNQNGTESLGTQQHATAHNTTLMVSEEINDSFISVGYTHISIYLCSNAAYGKALYPILTESQARTRHRRRKITHDA